MSPSERHESLARLASLLLEAAGVATGERDDERALISCQPPC